jgi:hypothetical protein
VFVGEVVKLTDDFELFFREFRSCRRGGRDCEFGLHGPEFSKQEFRGKSWDFGAVEICCRKVSLFTVSPGRGMRDHHNQAAVSRSGGEEYAARMPASQPKGQHFVHRAYLDGFRDPSLVKRGKPALWVYVQNKIPFPQNTANVAKRNYYYCYDDKSKRQFVAEHGLAKLEGLALPVLNQLRGHKFDLTPEDRLTFAGYIALSYLRVPAFERHANRIDELLQAKKLEYMASNPHALKAAANSLSKKARPITVDELHAKLTGGTVVVKQSNRGWSVRKMFEYLIAFQYTIADMRWQFAVAAEDDDGFLTSDNPVSLFDPTARSIALASSPLAHFLFPVCRTVCLRAAHIGEEAVAQVSAQQVREWNGHCISRADTQIFAPFSSKGVQRLLNVRINQRLPRRQVLFDKGRAVEERMP